MSLPLAVEVGTSFEAHMSSLKIDKEKAGRDWKWMQKGYTGYTPQVLHRTSKMMVSKLGISYSRVQFSGEPCQTENIFHGIQVHK